MWSIWLEKYHYSAYMLQNPTRGTLIDVILSPNSRHIQTQGVVDTGLSDYHRMVYVVTKNHASVWQRKQVTYRSFKNLNEKWIYKGPRNSPFPCRRNIQWCRWSIFLHVPLKTRNVKPNPPPFMNSTCKKAIMNKASLQHKKNAFQIAQTGTISGYKEIWLQSWKESQ